MEVSASRIIEGLQASGYVFWKESIVFGKSLECRLLDRKLGSPSAPLVIRTEAICSE